MHYWAQLRPPQHGPNREAAPGCGAKVGGGDVAVRADRDLLLSSERPDADPPADVCGQISSQYPLAS